MMLTQRFFRLWTRLVFLPPVFFVVCQSAHGQAVLGTLSDSSRAVVPGAKVTLTDLATGISSTTVTDDAGNYQFVEVKIGAYRVTAEKGGFATAVAKDVTVVVNARQRVDLILQVGQVSQTVNVTEAAPLVESETSDRGQVISRTQIVQLPLNGRDPSDLALLSGGVVHSANDIGPAAREGTYNVNGLRSGYNNYVLDGLDNNAMGTSNQGFSSQVTQLSPDAVAEFKVETNNTSAEYGRGGGAQIVAVSKRGTNQFRGDLWEFVRNTRLNAGGFFRPTSGVKPTLTRHQFGGALGGPILRSRTFFFFDAEVFRQVTKSPIFSTLPTLNDRVGNFSVPVQNPLTGEVFPANTPIPPDKLSPFARRVLADLPAPIGPGRSNNFGINARISDFEHKEDLRIDHRVNDRINVLGRVSNRLANIFNEPGIPGPSGGNSNGFVKVINEELASGATWAVSPNSLLDMRFGIVRTLAGKRPPLSGGPSMLQLYGITGLPTDPLLTGGLTAQVISGFSQLGRQATNPQFQNPKGFNPKVSYTWIHGQHTLKGGYEFQWIHTQVQDLNTLYGRDTYDGQFSKPTGGTGDAASYNFADFLFGLRRQFELQNFFVAEMRQRMQFAYVQDDWKLNPRLTFNFGWRYEYATPMWELLNRLSNYDPQANSIVVAKDGSILDRTGVNPDHKNFAPRIGLAYSLRPNTVIRASYGIFYNHVDRVGSGNILAINGPQIVQATIVQSPTSANFRTTDQGYPAGLTDSKNFDPLKATVAHLDRNTHAPYIQSWFFSIQRQLSPSTVFDISYVGNHGVKLLEFVDLNQARPNGPTENTPLQMRRPIPGFAALSAGLPVAMSNYNALQAKLEHRYASGLYLLNSFTWSKTMDNSTQPLENPNNAQAKPQDFHNLRADYSVSIYDIPVVNTTSVVWALPYGRGLKFGSGISPLLDGFLGGWQISFINTMHSGQPINITYDPSPLFQVSANLPSWLGGVTLRPNVIGPIRGQGDHINTFFNKNSLQIPTDRSNPFGNAGRNIGRMDPFYQIDLGIQKNISLQRESTYLQFRAEFFNAFNKTNFRAAEGNLSSSAFSTIRSTFDPRQIQFGLKLYF